jgi:hypothetical protein
MGERKESRARGDKQIDIWTEWMKEIGNNKLKKMEKRKRKILNKKKLVQ